MRTNTQKQIRQFRIKIGDQYAALNFDLHDKGVLVKNGKMAASAAVFKNNNACGFAISRTIEKQNEIKASMFPQWKKFDPLKYQETPDVEEFWIDAPQE